MVKFQSMSEQDFQVFYSNLIKEYANEKVKVGAWQEADALRLSEEATARLLPNGLDTERHYIYSIIDANKNTKVGYMWFEYSEKFTSKEAFIYDFGIFEEFQGKGYGTQSMKALDDELRQLEIQKVSLHVFGNNSKAIGLYKKSGFMDRDIIMTKNIH